MADYIERAAVEHMLEAAQVVYDAEGIYCGYFTEDVRLSEIPSVDVAPVRRGRWHRVKNPQWPAHSHDMCDRCGWWNTKNALCYDEGRKPGHSLNYCPNCGAKMEEGER